MLHVYLTLSVLSLITYRKLLRPTVLARSNVCCRSVCLTSFMLPVSAVVSSICTVQCINHPKAITTGLLYTPSMAIRRLSPQVCCTPLQWPSEGYHHRSAVYTFTAYPKAITTGLLYNPSMFIRRLSLPVCCIHLQLPSPKPTIQLIQRNDVALCLLQPCTVRSESRCARIKHVPQLKET
jgi:hypothetical protein